LYYIHHYFNRFVGLDQPGTKLFLKEPSRAQPLAPTKEIIELSRAKGSKPRND
jgi:hypothetical protein